MIILLKTIITILIIYNSLLKRCNYIFNILFISAYNTIIDYTNFIAVINLFKKLKKVYKKTRLSIIIKYKEEGYYLIKGI